MAFAFFQVDHFPASKTLVYRRINDPHNNSSALASVCFIDEDKLEAAVTSKKAERYPVPGDSALAVAGVDLGDNKMTYVIKY